MELVSFPSFYVIEVSCAGSRMANLLLR